MEAQLDVNSTHNISIEEQQKLRLGNSQFIIDVAKELKLQAKTPAQPNDCSNQENTALAILYTDLFFKVRSYLDYEREIIACAALFLAAKTLYQKTRIQMFFTAQRTIRYKMANKLMPPYKDQEQKRFTEKLCTAECDLLKVVNFKLDLENCLPFDYARRFTKILFEQSLGKQAAGNLMPCAQAIGNDSFLTDVNLKCSTQAVALACVMLAAARYKYKLPEFCMSQMNTQQTSQSVAQAQISSPRAVRQQETFEILWKNFKRRQEYPFYKSQMQKNEIESFNTVITPHSSQVQNPVSQPTPVQFEKPAELEEIALRKRFDSLLWFQKIDERIDHQELVYCLKEITEFYSQQANQFSEQ